VFVFVFVFDCLFTLFNNISVAWRKQDGFVQSSGKW